MSCVILNKDLVVWSVVFKKHTFNELFFAVLTQKLVSLLQSTGRLTQEEIGALGVIVNMVDRQVVLLKLEKESSEGDQEMIQGCKQARVAAIMAMIFDAKSKSLENDSTDLSSIDF